MRKVLQIFGFCLIAGLGVFLLLLEIYSRGQQKKVNESTAKAREAKAKKAEEKNNIPDEPEPETKVDPAKE